MAFRGPILVAIVVVVSDKTILMLSFKLHRREHRSGSMQKAGSQSRTVCACKNRTSQTQGTQVHRLRRCQVNIHSYLTRNESHYIVMWSAGYSLSNQITVEYEHCPFAGFCTYDDSFCDQNRAQFVGSKRIDLE